MSALHRAVPLVVPGHTRPVTHLSFSPLFDDTTHPYLLISGCKDGNPMLREWTGDWAGTFIGHKGAVWSAKLSRDGLRAASGSADFTARFWDTENGEMLHSFSHNHIVRSVAISPELQFLLTGGQEKKVRIFDLGKPNAEPVVLHEGDELSHNGMIKSVVWFDENTGVSAGEDKIIKWWDVRSCKVTRMEKFDEPITSMELSVQTQRLVVTSGKTVAFIPAQPAVTDTLIHRLHLLYTPSSASVHPILKDRFVTGSTRDEWVRVHNITGEEYEVLKGHHGPVHCIEYSPDGELFASGSEDGTIRLWQTTPGKTYGLWKGSLDGGKTE
ncbi:WD40 repeat-like protein [Multifurca ochricompacta]|uniref:Serine-threonine kinase receptor-associated protein n=1 Tax=Multifurca ochricompacta TaxID=376703 RepID=A0AAD4QPP5_9AGAM|nr:WD40 repeat-like protein [Multifurca ochricompacta]